MIDTLQGNLSTKIPLSIGTVGARGKFKTNMADSSVDSVLIRKKLIFMSPTFQDGWRKKWYK